MKMMKVIVYILPSTVIGPELVVISIAYKSKKKKIRSRIINTKVNAVGVFIFQLYVVPFCFLECKDANRRKKMERLRKISNFNWPSSAILSTN
jgi:hypothetical protein